jgi:hypothetical protein
LLLSASTAPFQTAFAMIHCPRLCSSWLVWSILVKNGQMESCPKPVFI